MSLSLKERILLARRRDKTRSFSDISRSLKCSRVYVQQVVQAAEGADYKPPGVKARVGTCKACGAVFQLAKGERTKDARYCANHRGKGYLEGKLPTLSRKTACARCGTTTLNRTYCSTACRDADYRERPLRTRPATN
jgi:hypothetical protein